MVVIKLESKYSPTIPGIREDDILSFRVTAAKFYNSLSLRANLLLNEIKAVLGAS